MHVPPPSAGEGGPRSGSGEGSAGSGEVDPSPACSAGTLPRKGGRVDSAGSPILATDSSGPVPVVYRRQGDDNLLAQLRRVNEFNVLVVPFKNAGFRLGAFEGWNISQMARQLGLEGDASERNSH